MSRLRRVRRGWAVYALPLAYAVAAFATLIWVLPADSEDIAREDTYGEDGAEAMREALDTPAKASGASTFLEDLGALACSARERGDDRAAVAWDDDRGLVDAAKIALERYRDAGTAVLATSGYLDLAGNVWGAILHDASGWVDVVLVAEDGGVGEVKVVRLLATELEGAAG